MTLEAEVLELRGRINWIESQLLQKDLIKPAPKPVVPRALNPKVEPIRFSWSPDQGRGLGFWASYGCTCDRMHEISLLVSARNANTHYEIVSQCGRRLDLFLKRETE